MSLPELMSALPENARQHVDTASPLPMRMMASKGMAPLPPMEMVIAVCALSYDGDEKIATSAKETLGKLPPKILGIALDGELPPLALATLGPALLGRPELLEKLVLNKGTPDATIAELAAGAPPQVAEIIAGNQERCLRSEAIVRAIAKNGSILKSSLDRLFDFLVRAGVIVSDMPQFAEALSRLSPDDLEEAAGNVQLPTEVYGLLDESNGSQARAVETEKALEGGPGAEEAHQRIPTLKLISSLSVAQKVALALKGNREARTILVRDSNRVVATATIRSPRITEQEVVAAAKSRQVSEEVIRIIANTKELVRPYTVKMSLVNNPKTPTRTAMKFLPLLRSSDLRAIAKSKNVPAAVSTQAKRMVAAKKR